MTEQTPSGARIAGLLKTLATADPDYAQFAQQHAPLGEHPLPPNEEAALSRDTLSVMRESPQQVAQIETLQQTSPLQRFDGGMIGIPLLIAVTFLLRSHIKFKRRTDGKWEFQIEHNPADSKMLTQLLNRLAALLPGGEY